MKSFKFAVFSGLFLNFFTLAAQAETFTLEEAFKKCQTSYPSTFEAKKRLACFDSINLKALGVPTAETDKSNADKPSDVSDDTAGAAILKSQANQQLDADLNVVDNMPAEQVPEPIEVFEAKPEPSFLERKWRLSSKGDWNLSDFETYKSNYLLVTNFSETNNNPSSPNFATSLDRDLDYQDVKFQFSLKTELMKSMPIIRKLPYVTSSRLWAAYTQQSYWQFFNTGDSRFFRENNYEPELILSLGLDNKNDGIIKPYLPRMLNLGFVHQSNGREDPLSRSWNRIYLQGGWELNDKLTLMVRPTWRIPESKSRDDNPDIEKFLGYGDVSLRWDDPSRKMAASVLLRNNLRSENKGFIQLDFQRQITEDRNINFHILASSGYGASLLDYNVYQNTIGFGISLGE